VKLLIPIKRAFAERDLATADCIDQSRPVKNQTEYDEMKWARLDKPHH
jgi:hypothetical protein